MGRCRKEPSRMVSGRGRAKGGGWLSTPGHHVSVLCQSPDRQALAVAVAPGGCVIMACWALLPPEELGREGTGGLRRDAIGGSVQCRPLIRGGGVMAGS